MSKKTTTARPVSVPSRSGDETPLHVLDCRTCGGVHTFRNVPCEDERLEGTNPPHVSPPPSPVSPGPR
jgi:hypothetical protein